MVGDCGVGKTCILNKFTENLFVESDIMTIGVDFRDRILPIKDKMIKVITSNQYQDGDVSNPLVWLIVQSVGHGWKSKVGVVDGLVI